MTQIWILTHFPEQVTVSHHVPNHSLVFFPTFFSHPGRPKVPGMMLSNNQDSVSRKCVYVWMVANR